MSRMVKVLCVGKMNYRKCLKLQKMLCEDVKNKREGDTVVVVEHDPVYTVGIREKWYSKEEEEKLLSLGAEFERVDRGGLITFHGPGQLVRPCRITLAAFIQSKIIRSNRCSRWLTRSWI